MTVIDVTPAGTGQGAVAQHLVAALRAHRPGFRTYVTGPAASLVDFENTNNAVANGLQRSGRIITSAAFLVMIVFLGFAAGKSLGIKEFGLALAIAVAVDVTLVRCLLVPATMTLLGRANWWAPVQLRRLHERLGLHEAPPHAASSQMPAAAGSAIAAGPREDGRWPSGESAQDERRTAPVS